MKTSTLLLLALLVLALFGYIHYSGLQTGGTAEEEKAGKKIMVFKTEEVDRIEIQNPAGNLLLAKQADGKWMLESPVRYPANQGSIDTLLSDLEFSERRNTLSRSELGDYDKALESFGLKQPPMVLKLRTPSGLQTLALGNLAVGDNAYYALHSQNGKEALMLVEKRLAEKLEQKTDAWRNRSMASFTTPEVTALHLKTERQEVELKKTGEVWAIAKPLETPATPSKVTSYLAALLGTQILEYVVDNAEDLGAYGLNTPSSVLDISLSGDRKLTLKFGAKSEDKKAVYAQTNEWPVVFTIPASTLDTVANLLEQTRERRLLGLEDKTGISSFKIESAGKILEFRSEGGKWVLPMYGNLQASLEETNAFLDEVMKVEAVNFLPPTESNLKRTGLAASSAKLVLTEGASAGAAPAIHTVEIGQKTGANLYVRGSHLPFLLEVPANFYQKVTANKPDFKWFSLQPSLVNAADISGITWIHGSETFGVTRKGNAWSSANPAFSVDTAFLEKQLSILSDFTAVKWVGPVDAKAFAAASPVTLALETSQGSRKLWFGKPDKDGNAPACFEGVPFSFLMQEDDYQRLQLKPIEAAKTEPVPAATP